MKIEELAKLHKETGTFTCSHCKNIYDLNPDWDAVKEAKELWGDLAKRDDQTVLCDDCFNDFMEWQKSVKV